MTNSVKLELAAGWRRVCLQAVGGLTDIGFSADEKYLIAISANGRGVIETATGERVARDTDPPESESPWLKEGRVEGIGPINGQWMDVFGLFGGALKTDAERWSTHIECEGTKDLAYVFDKQTENSYLMGATITEVRAFGFSSSGRFLAFATSSDVTLYEYAAQPVPQDVRPGQSPSGGFR